MTPKSRLLILQKEARGLESEIKLDNARVVENESSIKWSERVIVIAKEKIVDAKARIGIDSMNLSKLQKEISALEAEIKIDSEQNRKYDKRDRLEAELENIDNKLAKRGQYVNRI